MKEKPHAGLLCGACKAPMPDAPEMCCKSGGCDWWYCPDCDHYNDSLGNSMRPNAMWPRP